MGYFSYLRFPSFIILSTKVHSPGKKKKKQKSPRPVRRKSFFALFYPFLPIFSEHFFLKQIALICIEPSLPFGRSYAFPDFSAFPDSAASSPLPVSSFAQVFQPVIRLAKACLRCLPVTAAPVWNRYGPLHLFCGLPGRDSPPPGNWEECPWLPRFRRL